MEMQNNVLRVEAICTAGVELWTLQSLLEAIPLAKNLGIYAGWVGEGTGDPLQYSCLENPMDGGAW